MNYQSAKIKLARGRGFTLIETMVSVAIFVVVAMIVTMVFITIVDANRKAQSIRLVMDNLNFSIDAMALRMREGTDYACEPAGSQNCDQISFRTAGEGEGQTVVYGRFIDDNDVGRIGRCEGLVCNDQNDFSFITAPQVNITKFSVGIDVQRSKRAVMLIRGEAGTGRTATQFSIQTSVSERN